MKKKTLFQSEFQAVSRSQRNDFKPPVQGKRYQSWEVKLVMLTLSLVSFIFTYEGVLDAAGLLQTLEQGISCPLD